MLESVVRVLRRPLFGTQVISPDARVDAAQFPEDEFPIYCTKCEYLLRGLPDGRCPECGEEFERGKLLVLEYVRWRVLGQRRYNQTLGWLSAIAIAVFLAAIAVHAFFAWRVSSLTNTPQIGALPPLVDQWTRIVPVLLYVHLAALGALSLAAMVAMMRYRRRAEQRRRILAGIMPGDGKTVEGR